MFHILTRALIEGVLEEPYETLEVFIGITRHNQYLCM